MDQQWRGIIARIIMRWKFYSRQEWAKVNNSEPAVTCSFESELKLHKREHDIIAHIAFSLLLHINKSFIRPWTHFHSRYAFCDFPSSSLQLTPKKKEKKLWARTRVYCAPSPHIATVSLEWLTIKCMRISIGACEILLHLRWKARSEDWDSKTNLCEFLREN